MFDPSNLEPLPNYPFLERPDTLTLSQEECATALYLAKGDIPHAASLLHTPSARLRKEVRASPRLQAIIDETREQLIDRAEHNLREALYSPESRRADPASRFALNSALASSRGWTSAPPPSTTTVNQTLTVYWANGQEIARLGPSEPKLPDDAA